MCRRLLAVGGHVESVPVPGPAAPRRAAERTGLQHAGRLLRRVPLQLLGLRQVDRGDKITPLLNSECGKTEINGESTFMVWPTLGARMAKEQNRACNLSLIASFLALLFHKAVWQHVPGVVGFVMTSLLPIYQGILQ